jgi:hypothetical protein
MIRPIPAQQKNKENHITIAPISCTNQIGLYAVKIISSMRGCHSLIAKICLCLRRNVDRNVGSVPPHGAQLFVGARKQTRRGAVSKLFDEKVTAFFLPEKLCLHIGF